MNFINDLNGKNCFPQSVFIHVFPLIGQKSCQSKMLIIFTYHCILWLSRRLDRKNVNAIIIAKSNLRKCTSRKLKMHFRYYYSVPISCFLKIIHKHCESNLVLKFHCEDINFNPNLPEHCAGFPKDIAILYSPWPQRYLYQTCLSF